MLIVSAREYATHHQDYFKEIGSYSHEYMNLAKEVKVQRSHAVIIGDTREEIHENELAVTLATVARLLIGGCFRFRSTFDDDDSRGTTTCHSYGTLLDIDYEKQRDLL
jgi:hypothetical protein